jgi:hypothetical protein
MKLKYLLIINLLISVFVYSQDSISKFKWLRSGVVFGHASQNTILKQDSDYTYDSNIIKFSNHFNWSKTRKHSWEILVEPSYYRSTHQLLNYWFISHKVQNGDELRAKFMPVKTMNEYVLNLGLVYRRYLNSNSSVYSTLNTGPMYIDTETERLKKGFSFSDVLSVGYNYKIKKISFDAKCMIRHVSNGNLQKPNYGYNSVGFEFGSYYEFN